MKRVLFAVFSTIAGLVMLLSFKTQATTVAAAPTGVATTGPDTSGSGTGDTGSGSTGSSTTGSGTTVAPSAAPSSSSASSASTTRTVTGAAADTRYGPVQVEITVTNGAVTSVKAVEYPRDNPRDAEINASAIPQLDQEATAAKSANIDTVSGATYTSDGYIQSLQSALNQAGL